jgi:hypothetical protein
MSEGNVSRLFDGLENRRKSLGLLSGNLRQSQRGER